MRSVRVLHRSSGQCLCVLRLVVSAALFFLINLKPIDHGYCKSLNADKLTSYMQQNNFEFSSLRF